MGWENYRITSREGYSSIVTLVLKKRVPRWREARVYVHCSAQILLFQLCHSVSQWQSPLPMYWADYNKMTLHTYHCQFLLALDRSCINLLAPQVVQEET